MLTELLAEVRETVQSPRARAFLSSALEFLRPYHLALGLRISRLSTTRVEIVVSPREEQRESHREASAMNIEPGALVTAATLAAQLLLRRMDQPDLGSLEIQEARLERLGEWSGELRGRLEFSKLAQETMRAELKKMGHAELDLTMSFFDVHEQRRADCQLKYLCQMADQLEWKGNDGRSSNSN